MFIFILNHHVNKNTTLNLTNHCRNLSELFIFFFNTVKKSLLCKLWRIYGNTN